MKNKMITMASIIGILLVSGITSVSAMAQHMNGGNTGDMQNHKYIPEWMINMNADRPKDMMTSRATNTMMDGGMMEDMDRNFDRHFIEQMIPHHEEAVIMADLALQKAKHEELKQLAADIKIGQTKEINGMRSWYKSWYGAEVPTNFSANNSYFTDPQGVLIPSIDPSLVDCTAFRPAKHPHSQQDCYDTANDFYQLVELILAQLSANNVAEAIQETLPTTPQMFPDGTVVYGPEGFASIAADWAGSNNFTFISVTAPTFQYRPLDTETVVAFGIVNFTIQDNEHGTIRTFASAQTELFRRNSDMPRGWEQIYEQLAYVQPLLGDQP